MSVYSCLHFIYHYTLFTTSIIIYLYIQTQVIIYNYCKLFVTMKSLPVVVINDSIVKNMDVLLYMRLSIQELHQYSCVVFECLKNVGFSSSTNLSNRQYIKVCCSFYLCYICQMNKYTSAISMRSSWNGKKSYMSHLNTRSTLQCTQKSVNK